MRSLGWGNGRFWLLALGLACGVAAAACDGEPMSLKLPGTGAGGGGSSAAGGSGGGSAEVPQVCGDGILSSPELCDDGNQTLGDGCDNDCSFSCTKGTVQGDARCDDGDPCNGAETCSEEHVCLPGKEQPDGAACGEGQVCKGGVCRDVSCGDGFVDIGEDCDDGNVLPDDGCDACAFNCVVDSDCDKADVCAGDGACAVDHSCANVPLADGSTCPGGACAGGACKAAVCGNGALEAGEACDDGNIVGGDGCEPTCQWSCADAAADCPAAPACNVAVCTAQGKCGTAPDPGQDGAGCGAGLSCANGACLGAGATCGNGVVESGEDCDFGAQNGPGTGCEAICKFSCLKSPDSCPDQNLCNGAEACNTVVVGGKLGQRCSQGSSTPACGACGDGVCVGGTCAASTCGDGCVDLAKGETCDPPSSAGCDAACKIKVCGNGVRESGEECDDGNSANLDGCSAACAFEQLQRVRYLVLQYATDALCASNKLGLAVVGQTAQSQLQAALDGGVQNGTIDLLLLFLSLGDLTGTSDPALLIGAMNGAPKTMGQPYDGTSDLDFWHKPDALSINADKQPQAKLPAQIAAKSLTAGPGTISLAVSFGADPAALTLSGVKLAITIGPASAPLSSAGLPPGHLASEHVHPALVSFASAGQPNANGAGKLCGNIAAASLAAVPVPPQLTMGGFGCSQGYSDQNTMLDVLVGGCTVLGVQQIAPAQPDQADPGAPVAGAGAPYTLVANAQKAVAACNDKNGAPAPLSTCLEAAAYSSFFKLATNRAVAK